MPTSTNNSRSLDYFGELSWANLLDWMVTLLLGGILVLTAMQLGGVRPETQVMLQPFYILLMALHGLSLAASRGASRKLNLLPILLIPFIGWALASVLFWTPTPWRGSYEFGYLFTALMFGWVAVNNVRTKAHLWSLIVIALLPVGYALFVGFYQFFQSPTYVVNHSIGYPIELGAQYLGQATGVFADPGSYAAFLILLLPCFIIAAFVPRLPVILKVFSFYLALVLVVSIPLTQTYWAVLSVVFLVAVVPWFCFEKKKLRYLISLLGIASAIGIFVLMYLFNPLFERGLATALTPQGEGIRLIFWKEVLANLASSPVVGSGAGSFSLMIEKSPDLVSAKLPLTPHNDFLLILGGYGVVGACLLFLPLVYVFFNALRQWSKEPFKLKRVQGNAMSTRMFFLSVSICAVFALILCASFHFLIYIPALLLYSVLIVSILVKSSFTRTIRLPEFRLAGTLYFLICTCFAATFWAHASLSYSSQGLELQARQRLESVVEQGISVSGNTKLVDRVITLYEDALIANPRNADAWIGLSMATCQLHYRDPADFEKTGARAIEAARAAYEVCPEYWLASAQLGVAYALSGDIEDARGAFLRAIDLAPNVSNAHYYYAAFLAGEATLREKAIEQVRRALEVNPENAAARRLEQKLLIL